MYAKGNRDTVRFILYQTFINKKNHFYIFSNSYKKNIILISKQKVFKD
jgi:hypothetical protein